MKLFGRRDKRVDIKVIETVRLDSSPEGKEATQADGVHGKPKSLITIVNKESLREQFSYDELKSLAHELEQASLPDSILEAQKLRQSGKIDRALLMLRELQLQSETTPEIEAELVACLATLEDPTYHQTVSNRQLAVILFGAANFYQEAPTAKDISKLFETRLTFACKDNDLRHFLERLQVGRPPNYHCYCLAQFDRVLDIEVLGAVQNDVQKRKRNANRRLQFVVCRATNPEANLHIAVQRFAQDFVTIPLERDEVRRAIVRNTAVTYLQKKISTWIDNEGLFATPHPVAGQGEFFGRENDLKRISGTITRGHSFYILGNRRMGKTSLIKHLQNLGAFNRYLYAYLSLEEYVDDENFDEAIVEIQRQWSEDFKRKDHKLASRILSQLSLGETQRSNLKSFVDLLEQANYDGQIDLKCLVILDDVNMLLNTSVGEKSAWHRGANQLVRSLRTWENIVITGLTVWDFDTVERIERTHGGGLGKYRPIKLKPLEKNECDTMIKHIGSIIHMNFSEESLTAIFKEAGGHPLWTRLLCHGIDESRTARNEQMDVTLDDVTQKAQDFIIVQKRFLTELIDSLKPGERKVLEELSRHSTLVSRSQFSDGTMHDALMYLKEYGWVEEPKPDHYRLRMNLLARYLRTLT